MTPEERALVLQLARYLNWFARINWTIWMEDREPGMAILRKCHGAGAALDDVVRAGLLEHREIIAPP